MNGLRHLAIALAILTPLACAEPAEEEQAARPEPVPYVGERAEDPATPGRDLAGVDMCQVLPAADVAEITGKALGGVARREDIEETQGCIYGLAPAAATATLHRLSIRVEPPALFEDEETLLQTARTMKQEATVEPVVGLGERAFMIANATHETYTVHVLREDDLLLKATAEAPEHAVAMAQLALERLGRLPDETGEAAGQTEQTEPGDATE